MSKDVTQRLVFYQASFFRSVVRSKKFDDQTQLITAFRGTGVCGVVSFMYSILLPVSGSSSSSSSSSSAAGSDVAFPLSTSKLSLISCFFFPASPLFHFLCFFFLVLLFCCSSYPFPPALSLPTTSSSSFIAHFVLKKAVCRFRVIGAH